MADWPYNTAAWRHLRAAKLAVEPVCQPCKDAGRLTLANTVDHDVPVSGGGAPFPPLDELTSMCPSCHGAKTARGVEAGGARTTRALQPRKGCDAEGNPLDPSHPWSGKSLGAGPTKTAPSLPTQLVSRGDG